MLIITADDYGKTRHATDSILKCFVNKRIMSASAMVFMEDSERAAAEALETNLEVGIHLNFTMPFSDKKKSQKLSVHHNRVVSYLTKNKFAQIIYNPLLIDAFHFLCMSQQEEFMRLYNRQPDFYNGHHHMHLCANVLLSKMIPVGSRVRGTFTFGRGEKHPFNLFYRHILDIIVSRRFIATDCFYSIVPVQNAERLQNIFSHARENTVEIEVHPENAEEIDFLLCDHFKQLIDNVTIGTFQQLQGRK